MTKVHGCRLRDQDVDIRTAAMPCALPRRAFAVTPCGLVHVRASNVEGRDSTERCSHPLDCPNILARTGVNGVRRTLTHHTTIKSQHTRPYVKTLTRLYRVEWNTTQGQR